MGLIVATTFAISVWLVLWALGTKPLYASVLAIAIILTAAGVRIGATKIRGLDAT